MQAIAIIGNGRIGGIIASFARSAGYPVRLSAGPGTNVQIVEAADIIVLAVPWTRLDAVAEQCAPVLAGKILIDATNPCSEVYEPVGPAVPYTSGGMQNAARFSGARVVKAFNTLPSDDLAARGRSEPRARIALALSGDDADAKAEVADLILRSGYEPVDLGALERASRQEPGGPYYARVLAPFEMRNGEIAWRFVTDVLARGDMQAFDELVADSIVVNSGISPLAPMAGKEAFREGLGTLGAFSRGELHVQDVLPAGDRVTVRYVAYADHTGPQLGVPPTGKRIKMWEIRLMRIAESKIVEDFVADINYDWPWLVAPRYRDAWLRQMAEHG
jgi:predicted dinucleotide-binding enzyme/predicted ester cyclase